MPLEEDLYKSLVDESKLYREKVPAIWLQKFTMLGAIIVFAVTKAEPAGQNSVVAAAILSLPIIALLLDLKLGEFGIHANVIDHFIIRNFPDPPIISEWERTKWGLGSNPADRRWIRVRSVITVAVTVAPTCIIAVLSALAARPFLPPGSLARYLLMSAICFCPIYLAIGLLSIRTLLFRR